MSTVGALQATLAGEHACVYGYGLLGAYVADDDLPDVRSAYETHRGRREVLAFQIRIRHAEPVAALAAYAIPIEVTDPASARQLAGLLEQRLAVLYADLVEVTSVPELRELAATTLVETAVLATRWTDDTAALPGLDAVPEPPE
jgi:hypothetical protein